MDRTAQTTGYARIYPTTMHKIGQRLCDLPWKFGEYVDSVFPSEFAQLHRRVRPYTMVGYARLRGLYRAIEYVLKQNIEGDIVECGVAQGGSAALMGLAMRKFQANRTLWVFDNFAGMPAPTSDDPDYEIARTFMGTCRGEFEEVEALFAEFGVLEQTVMVKGLFEDTLPQSRVKSIAVLHIDGDWYRSVKVCLETLYERVTPGGVIQIDDYGHWAGAGKAVDEFINKRSLGSSLRYLDYSGRQFRKPLHRIERFQSVD